jgi:hypothetical protein
MPDNGDSRAAAQTGEIDKMELDGTIIGEFGRAGKLPKEFSIVNAIDCRNESELLVGELGNWRVQRVTLHSDNRTPRLQRAHTARRGLL